MTLPRTGGSEWAASQASPWDTVNTVLRLLDAGACRFLIEDRDLTAPPGSCADGACYLVAASATGDWVGEDGKLAVAIGANAANGWQFITVAAEGIQLYVRDENATIQHDGSVWEMVSGSYLPLTGGTLSGALDVPDEAYDSTAWNGSMEVPTKNALRDVIEALAAGGSYTDEQARDAIGAALVQGGGITITVDDGGDTITIAADSTAIKPTESLILACSDETTALTTGTAKLTFRMPYPFTVTAVYASLTTPQASGSIFTVDINEAGASILSTKLTIDNTEDDSDTATTPAVISDSSLAHRAKVTVDIDQIGDGTAKGLKVTLVGYRT